jgi:cytidylate kinase
VTVRWHTVVMAPVVTLSASFGAGGSIIGPRVAEELGLPFLDRAIPVAVAEALAVPMSDVMAHDERRTSGLGRLFASLARAAAAPDTAFGSAPTAARASLGDQPEQAFRDQTERIIHQVAETNGGVILGRAAAIVLRDRPSALHVRLDGPSEARIRRAVGIEGIDEEQARKLLEETDRAREAYVKHFYRCDPRDACHYHLVLDSTALEVDACVDLIVAAAKARNLTPT